MKSCIYVSLNDILYHVADISTGTDKQEIFYSPKESAESETGWDLKKRKVAGRIDHISFHQDGNVHVKYKKINRDIKGVKKPPLREPIGKLEGGLLPGKGAPFTPLIIDSIYRVDDQWLLPTPQSAVRSHWSVTGELDQYSLLLLLVEKSRESLDIFKIKGFQNIFVQQSVVEIDVFDQWKIAVFFAANTLPILPSEHCEKFGLTFGSHEATEFGRNIVVPNMLAFEHLAIGRSVWAPKDTFSI